MNKKVELLLLLLLISCKAEDKYTGNWIMFDEIFFPGVSMEIKSNGNVVLISTYPLTIGPMILYDLEGNIFSSTGEETILDVGRKEGFFDKKTFFIIFQNNENIEKCAVFSDGETFELHLDNGAIISFKKNPSDTKSKTK